MFYTAERPARTSRSRSLSVDGPLHGGITVLEASIVLGVSSTTVVGWVREGSLTCRRGFDGQLRLTAHEVAQHAR